MSDYEPPQPIIFPPIFNSINWPPFEDQVGGVGGLGPQGPQGTGGIGNQGFQGRQGPQGNQGNQGDIGTNGNQGNQGNQGNVGFQGVQGLQGLQGLQGIEGLQGSQGLVGSTGATGGVRTDVLNTFSSLAPTLVEIGNSFSWTTASGVSNTSFACCSGNGRYIYITNNFNTNVARSSNFGRTFTTTSVVGGFGISCSADGRIIYISGGGTLSKSTNYGVSFSTILTLAQVGPVLCSSDGKYVYMTPYSTGNSIYRSVDYGATFSVVGTNTGNNAGGQGCCSASGQFIVFPQEGGTRMLFSSNYGDTWTLVSLPSSYRSGAISASGQFITICAWFSNLVMVSDDYGASFRTVSLPVSLSGMAMSATGQYQFVGSLGGSSSAIYFSDDWGNTWNTLSTPNTATDNAFNVYCSGSGQILGYAGGGNTYISVSYLQTLPQAYGFTDPVFIGLGAGLTGQQLGNVAIGFQTGMLYQNSRAVAIGYQAGMTGQGANSIAIGAFAGSTAQAPNSIVLNASGLGLTGGATGFYVKPIRDGPTGSIILSYNNTSGEIFYTQRSYYAQYYDTTDQANTGGTGQAVTFNTTDFQSGISLVSNSRITVSQTGKYALSYSLQFINTNSQEQYVDVFFWKNGVVLPDSNSQFAITRNQSGVDGKVIAATTLFFDLVANDYLELYWYALSTDVDIEYIPAGTYIPATPSAFVNIQLISS